MASTNSIGKLIKETVSGSSAAMTITNSSNTANSNAYLEMITGGASSGDPFVLFGNGTGTYAMGIDNSDSDAYVTSLSSTIGTSNAIKITTAGNITTPLTSAFFAYMPDTANVTGTGTVYTLAGYTEVFDQASNFNATTGQFTAPRAGRYLFTFAVEITNITAAMTSGFVDIYNNTGYRIWAGSPTASATVGTTLCVSSTVFVNMAANDTAVVRVAFSNGAGDTADLNGLTGSTYRSYFSGYLAA